MIILKMSSNSLIHLLKPCARRITLFKPVKLKINIFPNDGNIKVPLEMGQVTTIFHLTNGFHNFGGKYKVSTRKNLLANPNHSESPSNPNGFLIL